LDSFGRIGTFQWVRTNKNKKMFSLPVPRIRAGAPETIHFRNAGTIAQFLLVSKEIPNHSTGKSTFPENTAGPRPRPPGSTAPRNHRFRQRAPTARNPISHGREEKAASRDSHPFDDRLRPRRVRLRRSGQAPFALLAPESYSPNCMNTRGLKRGNIER
jgi:hypothetical protein